MKKIFIIGGMGSGKTAARDALVEQGLPYIDLDKVGHDVLTWEVVKNDLMASFGLEVMNPTGEVNRAALARKAFVSPAQTRKLNRITLPRIEDHFTRLADELERKGAPAVVVEHSVFKNREMSLAYSADVVIAVLAPLEVRVKRAVAAGWDEADVRRRIAQQITDAERIEEADVVFSNRGTREELREQVVSWWRKYSFDHGLDEAVKRFARNV